MSEARWTSRRFTTSASVSLNTTDCSRPRRVSFPFSRHSTQWRNMIATSYGSATAVIFRDAVATRVASGHWECAGPIALRCSCANGLRRLHSKSQFVSFRIASHECVDVVRGAIDVDTASTGTWKRLPIVHTPTTVVLRGGSVRELMRGPYTTPYIRELLWKRINAASGPASPRQR